MTEGEQGMEAVETLEQRGEDRRFERWSREMDERRRADAWKT